METKKTTGSTQQIRQKIQPKKKMQLVIDEKMAAK
jgi:hypothetical protein